MSSKAVHIVWACIVIMLIVIGYIFLKEHDKRLLAEAKVEQLQAERTQIQQQTTQGVQVKQEERKQADTPQKQVEYVTQYVHTPTPFIKPGEAGEPPVVVYPDAPQTAQALADFVEKANVTAVQFEGCKQELNKCDAQVKELKKLSHVGFWGRLKNCGARVGVGAATGAGFGGYVGAAAGGGIGIASCFIIK